MDNFDLENEIVEITDEKEKNQEEIEMLEDDKKEEKEDKPTRSQRNKKKSLKEKWEDLDKNKKIIIIVSGVVILLVIIGLILYFTIFRKEEEKPKEPVENVVLEKDNYRYENGKLVFLDKSDREIGTYECENKESDKCQVAKLDYKNDEFDRVLTVNESGEEIERNSQIYHDNFVFVKDGEKTFLYDIDNNKKELNLTSVKTYNTEDNMVVIEDEDHKYGVILINANGIEYLIRPSYDYLGIVNPELAYLVAQDKDEYYILSSNGKKLSDNLKFDVKSVNANNIVGVKNNRYNLYDYDGNELLSDYDYISLHSNVIALVKGSRLNFVSDKLVKLTDDNGIRLNNSDYVKKYVYDKDNRLVDTKVAYEVSVNKNEISLTIGEDTKNINMLEGKVSNNLDYISYFDGKLYFYSDKEKDELIGSYTCTNKNDIKNENSTLDNCYLYTVEGNVSGIYNNEFIFINDNNNESEKLYYLYDLKTNKTRGTYSSLEFTNKNELGEFVDQIYTSSSFVIAKSATGNNKGNYGVLEISSGKVSGKVAFSYINLTNENNYYLLENKDKTYSAWDDKFNKISNEFAYIKLYEDFYVGINSDKLNVYKYDNTKGLLDEEVAVSNNEFEIKKLDTGNYELTVGTLKYEYDKNWQIVEDEPEVPPTPENPTEPEDDKNKTDENVTEGNGTEEDKPVDGGTGEGNTNEE